MESSEGSSKLSELEALKASLTLKIRDCSDISKKQTLIEQCKELGKQIKELKPKKPLTEKQIQRKKNLITRVCQNCKKYYETSGKTRIPVVYCRDCRQIRGKDILEWVRPDSFKCFQDHQVQEAEELLQSLKSQFRLDLHKTLNTIPPDVKVPPHTCCVSYVGSLTETRIGAREEIRERIKSGQLEFGVLVFERGSPKDPDRNRFTKIGSKAWFNRHVKPVPGKQSVFIDDSVDHVFSVKTTGICSVQITERKDLLKMIASLDSSE